MQNLKWWTKENHSVWERVKGAFRRGWDQTKTRFRRRGAQIQAVGKEPISPYEDVSGVARRYPTYINTRGSQLDSGYGVESHLR